MKKTWALLTIVAAVLTVGFTHIEQPLDWGKISSFITLEDAKRMTNDFAYTYDGVRSQYFLATPVRELLDQEGLMGVRIYYARYLETGKPNLVLVGVDEFGNDRLDWHILNKGSVCPPFCLNPIATGGNPISLDQARAQTSDFQLTRDGIRAHLFSASKIRGVLDQEGTAGLQIYYGETERPELIVLGFDENGEDQKEGLILDVTSPCPPFCHDSDFAPASQ